MNQSIKYHAYCVDCRVFLRGQPEIHRHLLSRCCINLWPDRPRNPDFRAGESPGKSRRADQRSHPRQSVRTRSVSLT